MERHVQEAEGVAETLGSAARIAEELANSITHGVGLLLSVVGGAVLTALAAASGSPRHLAASALYGATLVLLYAASTCYHGARRPRLKRAFRVLDHSAIYLLIAGTYTPFTLLALRGPWGWGLFSAAWVFALAGVLYKLFFLGRAPRLSTALYLAMGWMAVIAARPLLGAVGAAGAAWILAGGMFYTGGVWFFVRDHLPYRHAIWHLFVLGGSACHYVAVLRVVG
jgi:hemolysin III